MVRDTGQHERDLLMPVELVRKSAATGYLLRRRGEETMLNITLLEFLRQEFSITINGLDPIPMDAKGVDVPQVLNIIRKGIMEQPHWDVVEQAIIGNFSFSKFIMWNDIHNNPEEICDSKIVSSLVSGMIDESLSEAIPEESDLDEKFKAGDIKLPISADSSHKRCAGRKELHPSRPSGNRQVPNNHKHNSKRPLQRKESPFRGRENGGPGSRAE